MRKSSSLEEQIAKAQRRHQIDIVLVTIKEDVEQKRILGNPDDEYRR